VCSRITESGLGKEAFSESLLGNGLSGDRPWGEKIENPHKTFVFTEISRFWVKFLTLWNRLVYGIVPYTRKFSAI
jgi:hypothetical protein